MKNNFRYLLNYCFNELPRKDKADIEKQMLTDDMVFDVICGINTARRQLGSKEAVERHFSQTAENVRKKLFNKDT